MRRWLLHVVAGVSLAICLLTVTLWVKGYWYPTWMEVSRGTRMVGVEMARGEMGLYTDYDAGKKGGWVLRGGMLVPADQETPGLIAGLERGYMEYRHIWGSFAVGSEELDSGLSKWLVVFPPWALVGVSGAMPVWWLWRWRRARRVGPAFPVEVKTC